MRVWDYAKRLEKAGCSEENKGKFRQQAESKLVQSVTEAEACEHRFGTRTKARTITPSSLLLPPV